MKMTCAKHCKARSTPLCQICLVYCIVNVRILKLWLVFTTDKRRRRRSPARKNDKKFLFSIPNSTQSSIISSLEIEAGAWPLGLESLLEGLALGAGDAVGKGELDTLAQVILVPALAHLLSGDGSGTDNLHVAEA
jgi:hypothetical protein